MAIKQLEMQSKIASDKKIRRALGQQLATAKKMAAELEALDKLYQAIDNVGKVHFRVYTLLDGQHQLNLFDTQAANTDK